MKNQRKRAQGGGVLGFLLGAALGASVGASWEAPNIGTLTLVLAVLVGLAGAAYGDRFWHWLCKGNWLRWLP